MPVLKGVIRIEAREIRLRISAIRENALEMLKKYSHCTWNELQNAKQSGEEVYTETIINFLRICNNPPGMDEIITMIDTNSTGYLRHLIQKNIEITDLCREYDFWSRMLDGVKK